MMTTEIQLVLDALEYSGSSGLVRVDSDDVPRDRAYLWQEMREKFGVDAAYFLGGVPVVYFKGFASGNKEEIPALHRHLWNHNRAPLLIAVTPGEVQVYNCFAPPERNGESRSTNSSLLASVRLVVDILELRRNLQDFHRYEIEAGSLALTRSGAFTRKQRVDQRLLQNLQSVRQQLLDAGLDRRVVNSLIGRSIFVQYLEHRGILTADILYKFASVDSYADLLQASPGGCYGLFTLLAEKFNGDMFPITDLEIDSVKSEHLGLLGRFLNGEQIDSGQLYFWAYDFRYIPIELISNIYEEFLHEEQSESGAYYTPIEIVDFVLNEILPWDGSSGAVRVLDPSCGSGVFLVEAYRRLVQRTRSERSNGVLSFEELRNLLTECIFGVDTSDDAIRVAAFSCYLALLDSLEPKSIWATVRFPRLIGSNLLVMDFFDPVGKFNEKLFDVIVGNPPWQSRLSEAAQRYVHEHNRPVGDKQVAQAFLWKAPELATPSGRICILAPSKGVLFNRSGPNHEFRRQFFSAHTVETIVDFSAFRRRRFQNATAPMVAVFYRPGPSDEHDKFSYVTPHPSPLSEGMAGVVIAGDEVKRLSRRTITEHPDIWKTMLWGSARDLAFIAELRARFSTLGELIRERGWAAGEGATVNGKDRYYVPDLSELSYVPVKEIHPFRIAGIPYRKFDKKYLHRPANRALYQGPHVLLRCGILGKGAIAAIFLDQDAIFTDSVIGIGGKQSDVVLLKSLTGILNSSIVRYYQFLTSARWAIERDDIGPVDHFSLPCPILDPANPLVGQLAALVDGIQSDAVKAPPQQQFQELVQSVGGTRAGTSPTPTWQPALDELVFDVYGLVESERQIVRDTLRIAVDQFYRRIRSRAFEAPSTDDLTAYARAFVEVFHAGLGSSGPSVKPTVYGGRPPYRAVSFEVVEDSGRRFSVDVAQDTELEKVLRDLDRSAVEQHSAGVFFRRNVKMFRPEGVDIIKPAELRYWTPTAGYNDADEIVGQLLRTKVLA